MAAPSHRCASMGQWVVETSEGCWVAWDKSNVLEIVGFFRDTEGFVFSKPERKKPKTLKEKHL